jgi:PAS domain S-box-containing protein
MREGQPPASEEGESRIRAETRTILESLPVSTLVVDDHGICTFWSPAAARLLGHRAEDIEGRPAFAVILPGEREQAPPVLPPACTPSAPRDVLLHRADGGHVHARESIVRLDAAGTTPGYLISFEDMTVLTHQVEQFTLIHAISDLIQGTLKLDDLLHVILTCATAGTALSFNRAFLLLLADDGSEVKGVMGVGPVNREEADRIWRQQDWSTVPVSVLLEQYFLQGLAHDSPLDEQIRRIRIPMDNTRHPVVRAITKERTLLFTGDDARAADMPPQAVFPSNEFAVAPFIARNRPIGALVADKVFDEDPITEDDVTALSMLAGIAGLAIANARVLESEREKARRLEEALDDLQQTQERLIQSERLAAIGRLSAHLAHEIRNPLTTIGLYIRAIGKHWDGGDKNRDKIDVALNEISLLEGTLDSVLDFSRPRAPVFGECDPADLIADIHRSFAHEMDSRGIRVDVECEADIPLRADGAQLRRVFDNLVRNALGIMEDGGDLRIEGRRDGDQAVFGVTDTGPGIPGDDLERIFEPFFTTRIRGSGLGLAISRKIIQDHGGALEAQSPDGGGAAFTITLPLRPRPARRVITTDGDEEIT